MNLTKLTTTSFLALCLALPAGAALSQDKNLNTHFDQTTTKIAQATDNNVETDVDRATDSVQDGASDTANAVEDRANWGWLGLLGLLGLIGLAGKGKRDNVVEHREVEPLDPARRSTTR